MGVNRLAAVGVFVISGALLFAVGIFMIGDRRMFFVDTFRVYAEFATISGLAPGATVRLSGLQAGEVEAIHVPVGPGSRFRIRMRIRGDLRNLVRLDSVASIQNDGLVGNKFVQIEVGTEESPVAPDEATIQSREPFDFADLLERLSDTVETVNQTILEVKDEVDSALEVISATAETAQNVMDDVGREARRVLVTTSQITEDLQVVMRGVRDGRGTIGQLLTDDTLYQRAKAIAADAERTAATIRQASEEARTVIAEFRSQGGPIKGLAGDLQETLDAARVAMTNLAETTEALKHNFLFRGFFNRRGYFALDDLTVEQYRSGQLEASDRRALRIWIRGDLLFAPDAEGRETLTDAGRARLDSAMSQFVKYPRTSLLVVEGYAQAVTADARYLLSRSRAAAVMAYLVEKFGRDPAVVTTMPMGSDARESPAGDTWDGVALALFVSTSSISGNR